MADRDAPTPDPAPPIPPPPILEPPPGDDDWLQMDSVREVAPPDFESHDRRGHA